MSERKIPAGNDARSEKTAEVQTHPYQPFVPETAKVLILGSAPPSRFCTQEPKRLFDKDMDWYYGSCGRNCNLLWEMLFRVFEPEDLPELDQLRRLDAERMARTPFQSDFLQNRLKRWELGMLDILARFKRRSGKSSDADLTPLEFTPLLSILAAATSVKAICCAGRHRVLEWLLRYLDAQKITVSYESEGYSFELPQIDHPAKTPRLIRILVLPSPSPIGRIRFPNHQAWLEYLTSSYSHLFKLAFSPAAID